MKNKKFSTTIAKAKRFLEINWFVQRFRFQTFGWWYWIDLSATIVDRSRNIFDTYMLGLILNNVQQFALHQDVSLSKIYWYFGITIGVKIIITLYLQFYNRFDPHFSSIKMNNEIEKAFINKLVYLNWEHIENPVMEKRINMTFNRSLDYIRRLADLHIDAIVALITLIATFTLARAPLWIILIVIIRQIPSIILTAKGAKMANKVNDESQFDFIKKGSIFGYFRDFNTLLEIKISQGHEFLKNVFDATAKKISDRFLNKDKKLLWPWMITMTYENVLNAFIYIYYLNQVLFNGLLLGSFQSTTNLLNQIGGTLYGFIVRLNNSVDYYRYVSYAYDLLELKNDRPEGTKELNTDTITIEFKDVWFKYPGAKKYSLKGVSFIVEDNARLAIVGENGAGKSTFLKLINRIYVPTKGQILVNGIPTNEYTAESYNSKISVVTQDFARYSTLPVAQNIAIYDKDRLVDMKRVKEAARLAEASGFIEKLAKGYDTNLSKRLDEGTELSTGQWQRIAVARQFYANRPLVILDEPTSAIDPIAESKIFSNLYEHVKDKTVIVVSHRYNTVRAAKEILVFNDGQIIEKGSHEELLALNGYYAKAFDVQQTEKKL